MNQGVIIGVLAFIIWGSVSSWWYVCEIRGLCEEPQEDPIALEQPQQESIIEESSSVESDSTKMEISDPPEEVPIVLSYSNIYFKKNSSSPDRAQVAALAQIILDTLGSKNAAFLITGHTCDLGSEEFNQKLGLERAQQVGDILSAEGITLSLSLESKGESAPLNDNSDENERARNRRVEIDIKSN